MKVIGLEREVAGGVLHYFDTHVLKQTYEVVDIEYVGYVLYVHLLVGEKACTYHLKSFVFQVILEKHL